MSFVVDRYSSAWAHIALCADLTWATEPPDEFIIANQRLWAKHCRVTQLLPDSATDNQLLPDSATSNKGEITDKRPICNQSQENGNPIRRSVKDIIPESRLVQYGNFYYDDIRENCYVNANDKVNGRGYNGQGSDNSDLTECWMLPEVDYWFRKLLDDPADKSAPRRRRHCRMLIDDDFYRICKNINGHQSAASERWAPAAGRAPSAEESTLAARVSAVRALWSPRPPPPPPLPPSRKMRARRRQPRRLAGPPPLAYCLEAPPPLICDPSCKFQFQLEPPRAPPLASSALERLTAHVGAVLRAGPARAPPAARSAPYRGTNVSRYTPTSQRPARCPDRRCGVWWPRDHPKLDNKFRLPTVPPAEKIEETKEIKEEVVVEKAEEPVEQKPEVEEKPEAKQSPEKPKEKVVDDGQTPSTSSGSDMASRTKRLYSTVLSTSPPPPPPPPGLAAARLAHKLSPGLLKLNPKLVLQGARRPPSVEHKFEELEQEALDQYKGSDESIDSKFRELEQQAEEQYSASTSNTSCSDKRSASAVSVPEEDEKKTPPKFPKDKSVDSVVIYSQTFPDAGKAQPGGTNLKNFHTPPRGEKKEQVHRPCKSARHKGEGRAGSDTDHEREGRRRWAHAPPKKRHLTLCVSDCSSDEEAGAPAGMRDAAPAGKARAGRLQPSAHGGGDRDLLARNS